MIREELFGGPLDGLYVVLQPGVDAWTPGRQIVSQVRAANGARYYRRGGHLYYEFSNWDLDWEARR